MENTVETLGALERRLHVAVPIADIEGEVKKRLTRLARTVKVAGFRPGKAPLRMLDQQYGPQVRSDVITERVQTTLNDARNPSPVCFRTVPPNAPHAASKSPLCRSSSVSTAGRSL